MLKKKLDKNIIKNIENYMFYDIETMNTFKCEWKEKMNTTNCFLFHIFNNMYQNDSKIYETPCWYCVSKNKRCANSHSVFECIRYYKDLNNLSKKISKINKSC